MKRIFAISICAIMCVMLLASCEKSCVHTYGDWQYNEYGHWQPITCSLNTCNLEESPISDHVDDNTDNICDICGYTKMSSTEQPTDSNTECVHTYGEWQYDETYHWCDWSCSLDLCDIDTTGEHIDKDGDSVCDTCNYIILNCVHTYGEWQYNETHHWRDWSCSLNMCRIETTGEHFDEDENGVCDKCGYFPPINSDVMGFNLQKIVFDSLENTKRTPTKDTDVIDGINSTIKMGSNAYDAIEFCFYYNGNVSEELFEDMHYSNIVQANEPTRMIVRVKYNNINIEALKTLSQSSQIISIHISAASDLGVEPEPDIPMVDAEVPDVLIKIEKWNGDKFEGTVVNHLISYLEAGDKVLVVCDNQTMASETLYPIGTLVIVRFGRFDANVQPNILYAEAVENGEKYGNDNNNYVTIGTAVSDVMSSYAISCKIPQEYSTDNTDIPILLSFGLIEGCDADTDNFSEIVLRAENDDGQTVIIKRINISEILKIEYLAENVWDENREWIIGFNYTHTESIVLPLSLFAGTSGQIHIGLYECSSTDLETMKLGSGAYIVLYYTRNESSISISAAVVR